MADDWEDWENEDIKPLPTLNAAAKPAGEYETKGQALLAAQTEVDMSKFADEDKEEEKPKEVAKPAAKKPAEKKDVKKPAIAQHDVPLDDPVAEKLRQQRLIEESDFRAAQELFGTDDRPLDTLLPKTLKDFDEYADILARKYITAHADNKNYKAFLKTLMRYACSPLPSTEIKDLETSLAGVRTDKSKAEAALAAANAKKGTKKSVNLGKSELSAGLEDYVYDDDPNGDDYDFM